MSSPVARFAVSVALLATYYLTLFGTASATPAAAPIVNPDLRRDIEASSAT